MRPERTGEARFGLRVVMAGLVLAVLAACVPEDRNPDGPSTETGNPALAGVLRETSGRPAAGAWVRLYRIPRAPDSASPIPLDSLRTGADGGYRFDSLPAGSTYALEGSDAARSAFAFLPRAEIPAGAGEDFLRRDTLVLRLPGRLRGIARRDSNPRPPEVVGEAGILVRVIGLDRAAYTDSAGRYALDAIPEGAYSLHFMAADGHYLGEVAGPVAVSPGADVELAPVVLDWSPFVAPPSPAGLAVTPDSAAGVIRLRWDRVFVSNFDHYRILRSDTPSPAAPDTFRTRDTVYADTVGHMPAGRILQYRVLAVNTLGRASENPGARTVRVPAPEDTTRGGLEIAALVLSGGVPARALVRLYVLSPVPDPLESLPRGLTRMDSARAGADGRVRFDRLRAGTYTLIAAAETGADVAGRLGVAARRGGAADTLRLAAPGSLRGMAKRQGLWCSDREKMDENFQAQVVGSPWHGTSDFSGQYRIAFVPAGEYRVAITAQPQGCLLPDTLAVSVAAGKETALPDILARPDPGFIPVVTSLHLVPAEAGKAALRWNAVPGHAYPDLGGYRAYRRDAAGAVTASSGLLEEPAWTDDVSGLPSGTKVGYVVRVVRKDGTLGPPGGDWKGEPVYFTAP